MTGPDSGRSLGVEKYVELAKKWLASRKADFERAKKLRFDTISVHGMYTMSNALDLNHGSTMEPTFTSGIW